ncbi:hypothetical protein ALC62_15323 [Cyphomyrmex costatus]|uniref:C2H2-type domain-containing protein n=1 Tax=Cyphomyrmex costatus TaxID=456900 RepID=A0A151I7C5_9HYME|nr:hypothetical protein ALC62_15323 [Cyphomyrmex costatus]
MEDYVRVERELLEQCGRVDTLGECFAWLERCNECIESLECRAKRPRLTVGHRQSTVARIARLEGARTLLERQFVHVGHGVGDDRSLAWREIDAAFANRVLTGAVINSGHIEPWQFLKDAESVVLERVRGAIDRHGSVKVNTAFNGEFVAGDKRTVMNINGKNCELYRCNDLHEWHVNLLYVQDGNDHFVWIEDLSRLVSTQINGQKNKKYFCDRCLHYFSSNEKLESHAVNCQKVNECAIRLPCVEQRWLEFSKHCRKERVPFIMYADLECVLRKTEDASPSASSYAYQRHEVYSIAYYVHCSYDGALSEYRCRRGNDCVSWFARQLEDLAHRVKNAITANRLMDFTRDDWRRFDSATYCHICERPFAPGDERARDHCHLTGRYRGPAHKGCNVNYKVLIAVELRKLEVKLDKPIYMGMCILDISKMCLYEFHHEYMTPLFRDRCRIVYTDTDNLIYHIECDDVYETMKRDIDRFDTSDYPANNAYGMPLANKKVPGLMKDENNGAIMTEFVGLRAKMYALRVDGKRDTKKAKGVKSSVVARTISFEDYTRCLNDDIEMTRRQACIRSKLHRVYTGCWNNKTKQKVIRSTCTLLVCTRCTTAQHSQCQRDPAPCRYTSCPTDTFRTPCLYRRTYHAILSL